MAVVFNRGITPKTPGVFRTKVTTKGVDPQITCYYKSSRMMKQYFKEHRALRTETVVCDTRDFRVGRRRHVTADNWNALRAVGENANKRLCDAEAAAATPAPDVATFTQVTQPSTDVDGLHAPGLRFGDPKLMALLPTLVGFAGLFTGFSNRHSSTRWHRCSIVTYTSRPATYDLRGLRRKGLITRLPGTFRYQLTPMLFTKAYGRVLPPGLSVCDAKLPANVASRSPCSSLATPWRHLDRELDNFIDS